MQISFSIFDKSCTECSLFRRKNRTWPIYSLCALTVWSGRSICNYYLPIIHVVGKDERISFYERNLCKNSISKLCVVFHSTKLWAIRFELKADIMFKVHFTEWSGESAFFQVFFVFIFSWICLRLVLTGKIDFQIFDVCVHRTMTSFGCESIKLDVFDVEKWLLWCVRFAVDLWQSVWVAALHRNIEKKCHTQDLSVVWLFSFLYLPLTLNVCFKYKTPILFEFMGKNWRGKNISRTPKKNHKSGTYVYFAHIQHIHKYTSIFPYDQMHFYESKMKRIANSTRKITRKWANENKHEKESWQQTKYLALKGKNAPILFSHSFRLNYCLSSQRVEAGEAVLHVCLISYILHLTFMCSFLH